MGYLRPTSLLLSTLLRDRAASSFVRSVSLTFGTRLLGIAAGVVTLTITTRLLGPEGRGQFAVVMTALALVLQLSNFGLHASSIYYLSSRPELQGQITSLLFWFSLVGVSLVAVLAYALATFVPFLLGSAPLHLLGIALWTAPPAMFILLASNALLGLGSNTWFNALDLATKLVGLVTVCLLFWWPLAALFAGYAVLHYLLAAVTYARLGGRRRPTVPEPPLLKAMFGYGFRAFLVVFFMFLVLRVDLFLVNALLGTAEAGRYSVAVQVGEILNLAAASVAAMLFPRLSAMTPDRRWLAAWRVTRATALMLGSCALVLAFVSRPMFLAWFGAEFAPAVVALWWLLPGLLCLGMNTVLYQHLAASGMPWFLVSATSFTAALNIALNLKLIPAFGIAGAAGASSVSYALLLVLTLCYLKRHVTDEDRA